MLIKAARIRASAGAGALARHLADGEDNESITIVRGTIADLHDAVSDARQFNRIYALRHFVIAPEVAMSRQQFEQAARALGEEFGFNPDLALVVEHQKRRAVAGVSDQHWHLVVAETDAATGKVLSNRFSHPRHEKIARLLEFEFGHPITPGAHDIAVLAALRSEGHGDLADRLSGALGHETKPIAAYSIEAHQAGKRNGVDLAQARQHIRLAWLASTDGNDFQTRLAGHGLELAAGDKADVVIIRDIATGSILGAANRMVGVRRAEFNSLLERTDNDHQHPANRSQHRPDDFAGHDHHQAGPDHHSGIGEGDRLAAGGRESIGADQHGGPAADDRERGRAEPAGHPSSAPALGRTGNRPDSATHDRRGLTAAVTEAAAAVMRLSRIGIGQSQTERTQQHLVGLETQARAKIAAAEATPEAAVSNRLHAARLYRDGTHTRHAEMLKVYRAAQERLAAYSEPQRTIVDRLLGRQPLNTDMEALEGDVAAALADLVAAENAAGGADVNLARVERTEKAERAQHMAQMQTQRRAGMEMLAEVAMAQKMVRAFPALAYAGPAFAAWSAGKVERKRRRCLQNPWARNIWGLPIDFG